MSDWCFLCRAKRYENLLDFFSGFSPSQLSFATLYQPNLGLDTKGDGVEHYEKSRRMYGGIVAREHPVEFRVDG